MLKIKDSVDLKELEKYGFKLLTYINQNVYKKVISNGNEIANYIISEDRIIHYNNMSVINTLDNTLYDLMKDELIENVYGK